MTDRHMPRRYAALVVAGIMTLAGAIGPGVAAAAEKASLSGTVVNGTPGGPSVSNVDVTLHALSGDTEVSTQSARAGADGSFEFTGLAAEAGNGYALSTVYKTVTYRSSVVSLEPGTTKTLDLPVYETGPSDAKVKIREWQIWIDRQGSRAAVQHDLTIENTGKTTYAGTQDVGEGKKAVVRLPLPPGSVDFQYMGLFLECCAVAEDTTFIHTAAITPGLSSGTVQVTAPDVTRIDLSMQFPADEVRIFAPTSAKIDAPAEFKSQGTVDDRGVTYQVLAASSLAKGKTVSVAIEGLVPGGGTSLLWLLPAGAVALAAIGALAVIMRRRRRPGASPPRSKNAEPSRSAVAPEVGNRARELMIEEIAALDLAFERGAMAEETYRRVRDARMAELVELDGTVR